MDVAEMASSFGFKESLQLKVGPEPHVSRHWPRIKIMSGRREPSMYYIARKLGWGLLAKTTSVHFYLLLIYSNLVL